MKLGTLLSAALGAVSLLGSAVGCYVAVAKYNTMSDVSEARTRLQVARVVAHVVPLVASERGYATNIIFAPTPAEMPSRTGLEKLRALTDAAYRKMLQARRELLESLSDGPAIAQSIDALDAQFKVLRADMDRAFGESGEARKESGHKVNRENGKLSKMAADLVNEQIRLLAPLHGYAYRQANYASIAIALRGLGGTYSSGAKNFIALRRPATTEEKIAFGRVESHSDQLAASLMELRDMRGTPPNVVAALDHFKAAYITRFGGVVKRVLAEAETGKYSISLEGYYGESQPAMQTVVDLRDALYENAESALSDTYSKARTGFFISLAALVFTLAISAAAILVVVRGVSRPIMELTRRMSSLAGGDLDQVIPHIGRADEVGEMAGALVVFRDAAREKIRMEHAAEEARIASEQERLRTQAEAIRTERDLVVRSFGAGMARLAEKDLSFRLEDQVPEAYATLQADFNRAVDALEAALLSVAESSRTIAGGTGEISSAATDLAHRTESQAASLEQTAAAIDEITSTGRKAAEGAAQARDVVRTAQADAEKAGVVVRETVEAIGNIEKSSDQISRIIGVIDEIAFQTNLLALNAGVEAARAGEAGRGFAVVASEVRGLAQRSAEAAKEIKGLVTSSSAHVAHGVELVAATGKALERIMVQVNDINQVVGTIATGAETQASGLSQINTAITQMDQNTQQNAAMVEETTAASVALEQQATQLRDLISAFSLRGAPVKAVAPRARRRAA